MTLRALIFDVDGTLAETEEAHRTAFNDTFAKWGLDWHWSQADYHGLLKTTGGKERIQAFQTTLTKALLTDAQIAQMHKEKTARYGEILASGQLELRPGVADLIDQSRQAGLKLAVATTTNTPNVEALCQCCWGLPADTVFDHIAAGDMVDAKKPAPDVYQLALRQLNLPADQCLAFEDSLNGLHAAQAAGLRVLMTASAYTSDEDHRAADWQCQSLRLSDIPDVLRTALGALAQPG